MENQSVFVTHFNSLLTGGAANAARRLHEALLRQGTESQFFFSPTHRSVRDADLPLGKGYRKTQWERGPLLKSFTGPVDHWIHRRLFRKTTKRPSGKELFTSPRGSSRTSYPPANLGRGNIRQGDEVIHLHWIAQFIDYASFFGSLSPDQPIIWTLHDMNAFSGGCHFSEGCVKFKTGCGGCPQLPKPADFDLSRKTFVAKSKAISGCNLHIAAPSRWLLEQAQQSQMFRHAGSFHHIPYGISTSDFYPMDRQQARARLGIDREQTVVCFGAMDVKNDRKGARHLVSAFNAIADLPNVEGLVFGQGELPATDQDMPPITHVGMINGLLEQRTVFSASDVFVLPSLEDNLPLTGLEAMACGTTVLGFDVGGIPEYVREGVSGALASVGDSEALGRRLRTLVKDAKTLRELGKGARQLIEREYSSEREAATYSDLYQTLCEVQPHFE